MNDITSMRAITQNILGGPGVLKEVRLPRPAPGPGEVLIPRRGGGDADAGRPVEAAQRTRGSVSTAPSTAWAPP
ncbi:hypothetical protein GCM10009544_17320 [Streptomyces stramineus]|uniref:Uncharacterized protein n=1 Tax=Streptomyces stramineus TaxID=173861 RepID=A0ABP3JIW7_9ACTN